jgi:hypothetical protein
MPVGQRRVPARGLNGERSCASLLHPEYSFAQGKTCDLPVDSRNCSIFLFAGISAISARSDRLRTPAYPHRRLNFGQIHRPCCGEASWRCAFYSIRQVTPLLVEICAIMRTILAETRAETQCSSSLIVAWLCVCVCVCVALKSC